jgi:hypothetical protein
MSKWFLVITHRSLVFLYAQIFQNIYFLSDIKEEHLYMLKFYLNNIQEGAYEAICENKQLIQLKLANPTIIRSRTRRPLHDYAIV